MTPFRRLAVVTIAATFALIAVGGLVRATDSGLGCPDWPRCFGRLVPPAELHAWIEHSHRLVASVVMLLVAALVVAAWAVYLRGVDETGATYRIPDPRANYCEELVQDQKNLTERLLGAEEIFGKHIPKSAAFVAAFERQLYNLRTHGVSATLQTLLGD